MKGTLLGTVNYPSLFNEDSCYCVLTHARLFAERLHMKRARSIYRAVADEDDVLSAPN